MINVLGTRRVVSLLVAFALNAFLGALLYFFFLPQNEKLESDLSHLRTQIASTRAETDRLKKEYLQIQQQKSRFEDLKEAGFFNDQNRVVARERIEAIQKFTNVLSVKYDVQSARVEKAPQAAQASHVILNSPISMVVEAMDDLDIYNFIYWMENAFPGHVSVVEFNVERVLDVNESTLRQIGSGVVTVLVKGDILFDWRTIRPEKELSGYEQKLQ